jgi:KipI family sensor histidine kinase inhibitor
VIRTVAATPHPQLRRCGTTGWLLDLPDNVSVHQWAATVRSAELTGILEVVPGLRTLLITIDASQTSLATVRSFLETVRPAATVSGAPSRHVIDVAYDGEDIDEVARMTRMTPTEVVAAHTGTPWTVAFCGFAPGFSYLVGGDARLHVPRRDESRVRVPAGAVAIAGDFSSVYPRVSPGGWQLIGHTDTVLWDTHADTPAVLVPGDVVEFRDVTP